MSEAKSKRWRPIRRLFRRRPNLALTLAVDHLRPNSLTMVFIQGPVPEGWTQVPNNPGAYYRLGTRNDV